MKRFSFLATLTVFTVCSLVPAQQAPEPRYEGKPIGYWVKRFQEAETFETRSEAVEALKAFGKDGGPAVPALVPMLEDRSSYYRDLVKSILCAFGPAVKSAVPGLVKSLKEKTAHDPKAVIEVLGAVGPEAAEAIPVLITFLDSRDVNYQSRAADALGKLGTAAKKAAPKLRTLLKHTYSKIRRDAAEALWQIEKDPSVVPVLTELLREDAEWLAEPAAILLGKIGSKAKDAVPALRTALNHRAGFVQYAAKEALRKIEGEEP